MSDLLNVSVFFPKQAEIFCPTPKENDSYTHYSPALLGKYFLLYHECACLDDRTEICILDFRNIQCLKGSYKNPANQRWTATVSAGTLFIVKNVSLNDYTNKTYWEENYGCKIKTISYIDVDKLTKEKEDYQKQIEILTNKIRSIDSLIEQFQNEIAELTND